MSLDIDALYFARVLCVLVLSFGMTTFYRTSLKQTQHKRRHNQVLAWNEILGEQLFAYPLFYLTLLTTPNILTTPGLPKILGQWMLIVFLLATFAWIGGNKLITDQTSKLKRHHTNCEGVNCRPVGFAVFWKICGLNLILSVLAFGIALWVAILIGKPSLSPPAQLTRLHVPTESLTLSVAMLRFPCLPVSHS